MSKYQKKICMLGSFGVGKTSLVSRYVHSIFSEEYLTTIGVKIDKKTVHIGDDELTLILWDIAGDDRFDNIQSTYLIGLSGFLLVVDGCRSETLTVARKIYDYNRATLRNVPFLCLINKSDLQAHWEITRDDIESLREQGWQVRLTSAKDGESVEASFLELSELMVGGQTTLSS